MGQVVIATGSGAIGASGPPGAPASLSAVATAFDTIELTWPAVAKNRYGYRIDASLDGITFAPLVSVPATVTFYRDTGLAGATAHYYRVYSLGRVIVGSDYAADDATTPAAPTVPAAASGLALTATTTSSISVSWTDNSTDETGFVLEYSPTGAGTYATHGTVAADVVAYDYTGLLPDTGYDFRVVAFNAVGSATPSNVLTASTDAPQTVVAAPTALAATGTTASRIDGTYTPSVTPLATHALEYGTDGETWGGSSSVTGGTFALTGLASAPVYHLRLKATLTGTDSEFAGPLAVSMPVAPSAPSSVLATAISATSVTLSWTRNSSNETGFVVERAPDSGGSPGSYSQVGTTGPAVTTFTNTGLSAETTYHYRVKATNATGDSAYATAAAVATPVLDAPDNPTDLFVVNANASPTANVLLWSGADAGASTITVERKTGAGAWATLVVLGGSENAYCDTSAAPALAYTYRVFQTNGSGDSAPSAEASATTGAAYTTAKRDDPTALAVTALTPTTVRVAWTDPLLLPGSGMFEVERRGPTTLEYQCVKGLGRSGASAQSIDDHGLTPGGTYTYRVRLTSTATTNPSNYSAEVSVAMAARTVGLPIEPSSLLAVPASSTTIAVTWTNNDSGSTLFEVYVADWNAGLSGAYALAATTTAGATSYTITGLTAERPYLVKVRAKNGSGTSDYALPLNLEQQRMHGPACATCTASPGTGGTTYEIGPGKTYATPGAFFNAIRPGPGDSIDLYPTMSGSTVVPYTDAVLWSYRGTPASRITYRGRPDPTHGKYPIIDVTTGTASADYATRAGGGAGYTFGALWMGRRSGMTFGYSPGYVTITNIGFTGAYTGGTVFANGSARAWANGSAGIYVENGESVLVQGCTIYANGNGIFGAAQGTYARPVYDLTIKGNSIYGNSGTGGGNPSHNTYTEGVRVLIEENHYGPIRTGGTGLNVKDRSSGPVVGWVCRYNRIDQGGPRVEHCEAQNHSELAVALPGYRRHFVYGNLLYGEPGNATTSFWFGGDQGGEQISTRARNYLYHNTAVVKNDRTGGSPTSVYRANATLSSFATALLDVRNNVFAALPDLTATACTFGVTASRLSSPNAGLVYGFVGGNWFSAGSVATTANAEVFTGRLQDQATGVTLGTGSDPGFADAPGRDFGLVGGSEPSGLGVALPKYVRDNYPPNRQYTEQASEVRATYGAGSDAGAFEAAPDTTPPTVASSHVTTSGETITVTFSKVVTGTTGLTFAASGGALVGTYASGSGSRTYTYTLDRIVLLSESVTRSYSGTAIKDSSNNELAAFTTVAVTNDSTQETQVGLGVRALATAFSTATSTATIAKPTGTTTGDWLLADLHLVANKTVTATGWTLVASVSDVNNGGKNYLYKRKMVGGEASTFDFGFSASTAFAGGILRIGGAHASDCIEASATAAPASGLALTSPAVNTVTDGCMILRTLGLDRARTVTLPAGHLERWTVATGTTGVVSQSVAATIAQPAAGNSGTADFTLDAARPGAMITVALKPA